MEAAPCDLQARTIPSLLRGNRQISFVCCYKLVTEKYALNNPYLGERLLYQTIVPESLVSDTRGAADVYTHEIRHCLLQHWNLKKINKCD